MSIENAKEFLVKISTDEAAARKAEEAHFRSLMETAADLGYEVSEEDLNQAMEDISSFGELSEDQLEAVSGGYYNDSLFWFRARRFQGPGKISR
jgi:predicted ribosomally synthesized peptide with nif11-like leader